MTRSLEVLARLLPREDREIILGDICESGLSNLNAHFELSGLIWRRCLPPYAGVGDWICIAVAAIISPLLVGLSLTLSLQASREIQAGSWMGMVELLRLGALLWTASLAVGVAAMSRSRTTSASAILAILAPAIACAFRFHGPGLQMASLFLFAIPTLYGAWIGSSKRHYRRGWLTFILLLTLMTGPSIFSHSYTMLNALLLTGPAMYCWSMRSFGVRHVHS